jgi:hypothetical protein
MVMTVCSFIVLLHLAGAAALAAAPPLPPPTAQVQAVMHDARGPLTAGQRLTVRLRGTPGGVARFHIAGVAVGVPMREIGSQGQETALYLGTYVIRPGDAAGAAAITATLKVIGQEITKASDRPVTIDARPPEVTERLPLPGHRLTNLRPNIVLRFHDGETAVDPSRVIFMVNDQNVTARAAVTGTFAAYTPPAPFQPGPVRVQAVIRDRAGNTTFADWAFTVAPASGLIHSVTLNPAAGLKPGDYLTVVMVGAPRGQASLTIHGSPRSVPMRESPGSPGTYVGMWPVRNDDRGRVVGVSIRLSVGARSGTASAGTTIPVFGWTPQPTAVSPATTTVAVGDHVVQQIAVRGRTRPAFRVMAQLAARVETQSGSVWTPILAMSTSAEPEGTWQLLLGPIVPPPHASLFLAVVAVDPFGQRSPPVTIALGGSPEAAAPAPGASGIHKAAQDAPSAGQADSAAPTPAPPPPTPPALTPQPAAAAQCPAGRRLDPATGLCVLPRDAPSSPGDPPVATPPSEPPRERPEPEPPEPDPPDPEPDPEGPIRDLIDRVLDRVEISG